MALVTRDKTYDVVVLGFRPRAAEDPARAIARVIDVTAEEGESLIRNAPRAVRSNVDYVTAEACAASLGLAGAEVTIAEHPFDGHVRPDSPAPHVVEVLTTRTTEPGPAPEQDPPIGPKSAAASEVEQEPAQDFEAGRMSRPDRDSRIMSVLAGRPRGPHGVLRYAAVALVVALFYLAWLYLLERW